MTKNQRIILDLLRTSCRHLTAEEIFCELKQKELPLVLATVYNGLDYLTKHHEIRKIETAGKADVYDGNLLPHDHFFCRQCGTLIDVGIRKEHEVCYDEYGNYVEEREIIYRGICRNCQIMNRNNTVVQEGKE